MKLLKTYLRSTLSDENMLGLALAFMDKQMHVDIDEVRTGAGIYEQTNARRH